MENDKKITKIEVMNNVRWQVITFSEPFTYLGVGASAGHNPPLPPPRVSPGMTINLPRQNDPSSTEPGSQHINLYRWQIQTTQPSC